MNNVGLLYSKSNIRRAIEARE